MSSKKCGLTVIVPARNEEKYILRTIKTLYSVINDFNLIIINDNSTDHTKKIIEQDIINEEYAI